MKYRLSIIITCYNDPEVVHAIQSAIKQTYNNKEIIVVDDGSDGVVKNILKKEESKINRLIFQKNQGQSIARNNGIERATGEYILNLDSDDYFEPEFAAKAIKEFEEDETIKLVTCRARRFNKTGTIDIFSPGGGDLRNFLFRNSALGSSMFRKKDWEACGGYEEKLPILGFEDWEFYLRLLKNGGYAHVIPEVLFHYQVRKDSVTSQIKHVKQEKFRQIILKHGDLYKENYDGLVNNLFARIKKTEKEKLKNLSSIDYRLGKIILAPLRKLKKFLYSAHLLS